MNHLRDIEIRLLFQVYVQSLRVSWGLRWGNLADTCHLGWQTSETLQTTDCYGRLWEVRSVFLSVSNFGTP